MGYRVGPSAEITWRLPNIEFSHVFEDQNTVSIGDETEDSTLVRVVFPEPVPPGDQKVVTASDIASVSCLSLRRRQGFAFDQVMDGEARAR